MTNRDIRDIAAYWGAGCSISFSSVDIKWEHDRFVNAHLMDIIDSISLIKVHLRPVSALTDDEVFDIADIALDVKFDRALCKVHRNEDEINFGQYCSRDDGSHYHSWYWLSKNGFFGSGEGGWGDEIQVIYATEIFAYLQSIHVYLPGMINEDYVQLTP